MCRIAGAFSINENEIVPDHIQYMRDTMVNGGPDDAGLWINYTRNIGFGHRRLSIIDLSSAGHQPMHTDCGRYTICYNGEIYNFREIREELERKGVNFRSDCDTEVLLHAFSCYGINCLSRFHGMFAFAIWDEEEATLTLARDRIGVKPLYYSLQNGIFFFGSELKAIMAHPRFDKKLSNRGLELFLEYSYIPHPYTILEDTNKLGPGQWLTVNKHGTIESGTWWSLKDRVVEDFDWDDKTAVEDELEMRLMRSFERRMVADVPVGLFLSGGIDSSLLLALLSRNSGRQLKTFTIGFNESEYNEADHAQKVASAFNSDHHELYLEPDRGLEIIDQLSTVWDEPFGDNSAIATYLVSEFAVQHVKVALSADGGDELFCGYPKYWLTKQRVASIRNYQLLCRMLAYTPSFVLETAGRNFFGNKLLKIKDLMRHFPDIDKNTFIYGQHVFSQFQLEKLHQRDYIGGGLPQGELWDAFPSDDPLTRMMAVDLCSYHVDDIHVKVDRATMHNSLEAREPFLDQEIVEFAFGMPSTYKLPDNDPNKSKNILRKILYKYVDKSIIERPKMGFGVPLDRWLNNELKTMVDALLNPSKLKSQEIFNPTYVSQILLSFKKKPKQELSKVWNLLVFQMWYEKWMK